VHVRPLALKGQERGVQPAEPIGVRHRDWIVACPRRFGTFNSVYKVAVPVCDGIGLRDAERLRSAYARHHRGVYSAAFGVLGDVQLAQDVVQDVFLRFWRRPQAYDAARGELGAYLRLMARSRALDLWREGQVRARAAERLRILLVVPEADDPPALAERNTESHAVRTALRKLPDGQREALVLAYWCGLSADQIARQVHIPLGTAKSRIRLGLARLRDEFPVRART
jgi:RNA polymerase sigma-70 factor, ECF subfamily